MARRAPHPGLDGQVVEYCGYVERTRAPLRRREVANGAVVLVLNLGAPLHLVEMSSSPAPAGTFHSFLAELHDSYALTEHPGSQHGVQVELTPPGASRLLGIPMREVSSQVVELQALRGRRVDELVERLADAPSWENRYRLLDVALLGWAEDGPEPDAAVVWAWWQLVRSHGRVRVGALSEEIGRSRRPFVARFRSGGPGAESRRPSAAVPPSRGAPSAERADGGRGGRYSAGYADHRHLVREFRSLGGCTPSELLAAQLPDGGGIAAGG